MVVFRFDRSQGQWSKPQETYKNEQIRADIVVVIDEDGVNLWEFSREKAMEYAKSLWLDLVQVRYQRVDDRRVSTAKVIDYGKYLFDQKKKEKQKKLSQKSSNKWVKEIKIWYSTSINDVNVKVEKVKELMDEWYSIKLLMKLRWRERGFKHLAIEKMNDIIKPLLDISRPQFPEVRVDKYWMYQILVPR